MDYVGEKAFADRFVCLEVACLPDSLGYASIGWFDVKASD
jgi:hypothetical protein